MRLRVGARVTFRRSVRGWRGFSTSEHSPNRVPKELLSRITRFAKGKESKVFDIHNLPDPSQAGPRSRNQKKGSRSKGVDEGVGNVKVKQKRKGSPKKEDYELLSKLIKACPREYSLSGMCMDIHVASKIFVELSKRDSRFSPRTVLDVGCGTGGILWSLPQFYEGVERYTGVDENMQLLSAARKLCEGLDTKSAWVPQVPPRSKYDLVVSVDHFQSLTSRTRKALAQRLYDATNDSGILVIAVHGRKNFETINQVREALLQVVKQEKEKKNEVDGSTEKPTPRIIAPCPHMEQCPMQGERYGCHFGLRMPQLDFPSMSEQAKVQPNSLFGRNILGSYSFVAFHKNPPIELKPEVEVENQTFETNYTEVVSAASIPEADRIEQKTQEDERIRKRKAALQVIEGEEGRLVAAPLKKGGHVILEMCTAEGSYVRATIGKSAGSAYKAAKAKSWGDRWEYETPNKGVLKSISGVEVVPRWKKEAIEVSKKVPKYRRKRDMFEDDFPTIGKRRSPRLVRGQDKDPNDPNTPNFIDSDHPLNKDDEPDPEELRYLRGEMVVKDDDPDWDLFQAVKDLDDMRAAATEGKYDRYLEDDLDDHGDPDTPTTPKRRN
ncbi:hypothetical protein AAMO2058_000296100 [Amorphochlora amoebiformis]